MNNGILRISDMKCRRYKILYFILVLIMIIYCMIVFIPTLWLIVCGFKDSAEIYTPPVHFFPKKFNLSKLIDLWNQMKFYKYYINTFIMALGCVIMDVFVGGLAGYVLSKLKPKGSRVVNTLLFAFMLMPTTLNLAPLYMTFKDVPYLHLNLLDTYWPIWLLAGANIFHIILFKTAFDGISNSLIEAAKIDGASNLKIFFSIVLPLSKPMIMTAAIFTFNAQIGNFLWPYLVISDPAKRVLGMQMYMAKTSGLTMDYQMLMILFSIIPQIIVFVAFQKHIMGGMSLGGVKG